MDHREDLGTAVGQGASLLLGPRLWDMVLFVGSVFAGIIMVKMRDHPQFKMGILTKDRNFIDTQRPH